MASVSDRIRGDTGARSDRAQLLLVGALSLAIALVAVALVLNSAIYTHNLASRQDTPSDEVVTFARDARLSAGAHLDAVNRNRGSAGYATVGNAYVGGVASVADTVNEQAAAEVAATRLEHAPGSLVRGVRVVDDSAGDFAAADGSTDEWVVAHRVRVRSFEVAVPSSDLAVLDQLPLGDVEDALETPSSDDTFVVEFTDDVDDPDAGETWRVAVYDEDGTDDPSIAVHEVGTNIVRTCSVDSGAVPDPLVLDVTGMRFGGQACAPLSFVDDLPDTYSVRYYNGDEAEGTYELFADLPVDGSGGESGVFTDLVDEANYGAHCAGDDGGAGPTYHDPTSADAPRVVPAFYATSLDVRYDAPDVDFAGTQRVAPGEAGLAPVTPRITSLTVTEAGDGDDADFDVTVDVTDPNGDLDEVVVTLTGSDGGGTADADVSGRADSVSLTVQDGDNDDDDGGKDVTIDVEVVDADGNARTVTQSHEVDDDETGCPS